MSGFYSHLPDAVGDQLLTSLPLNRFVLNIKIKMETMSSLLSSINEGGFMAFLNL